MLTALRLQARQAAVTCAYCHDPLAPGRHACACGAAYHRDCWVELGRCATLGCIVRPDAADRSRAGCCPGCGGTFRGALSWERASCAGCGAVYHLGCRSLRARCVTTRCRSGAHDAWGAPPARPPLGDLLVELGDAALEAVLLRWRAGLAIPVAALAVWLGGADPVLATVAVGLLAVFALATEPPAEHG